MGDFVQIKEGAEYEENSFYTVKFGGNKYKARLVCIGINNFVDDFIFLFIFILYTGTKDYCKKCETQCIASINNSLKRTNQEESTKQKASSAKAALVDNLEKQKNFKIDLLKQEVNDFKVKIDKLQKDKEIEMLKNKSNQYALSGISIYLHEINY
jgi:hypothetical protein